MRGLRSATTSKDRARMTGLPNNHVDRAPRKVPSTESGANPLATTTAKRDTQPVPPRAPKSKSACATVSGKHRYDGSAWAPLPLEERAMTVAVKQTPPHSLPSGARASSSHLSESLAARGGGTCTGARSAPATGCASTGPPAPGAAAAAAAGASGSSSDILRQRAGSKRAVGAERGRGWALAVAHLPQGVVSATESLP